MTHGTSTSQMDRKVLMNERGSGRDKERKRQWNHSFWQRFKSDYKRRFLSAKKDTGKEPGASETDKSGPSELNKHLIVDQLAAKRKLEHLKFLTRTDLDILNSAEPYRVSSFILFKRNLLDPLLYISITCAYLLSHLIASKDSSLLSFVLIFACLFIPLNHHIESFRSFSTVSKSVGILTGDYKLRQTFLSTHLGYNPRRRIHVVREPKLNSEILNSFPSVRTIPSDQRVFGGVELSIDDPEAIEEQPLDSFHWINRIIIFFWPYLSHLIHYELNEFFRDQIDSGSLARSNEGLKRLFYAILKQLDTNILLIEKCQLGHQPPFIKDLTAREGVAPVTNAPKENNAVASSTKVAKLPSDRVTIEDVMDKEKPKDGKTLTYTIDLEYNGDVDIAIIYRYFCCCSSRMGLKDVFLHFKLQVVLGPIEGEVPFIDQISLTLLELPEFGYKGIALVELAELKIVRGVINRLIAENLLYPRSVTIGLTELVETLINGPPTKEARLKAALAAKETALKALGPDGGPQQEVSCLTRLTARMLLCGCMCSNIFLRSCQDDEVDSMDEQTVSMEDVMRRTGSGGSRSRIGLGRRNKR